MIAATSNPKDHPPGASLDYGFNYTSVLASGETITESTWSVTTSSGGSTLDITLSAEQIAEGITSVFATGGVRGCVYNLINTITTSNSPSRTTSRCLVITCKLI
jgi:hypothetical protein